jgi:hypothetical protein
MSTNKGSGDARRLANMGSNIDAWNGSVGVWNPSGRCLMAYK